MALTMVAIDFNGQMNDLVLSLPVNPVPTRRCTVVTPRYEVNVCGGSSFDVVVDVEANPPNGNMCRDSEKLQFAIDALPVPVPVPQPIPQPVPVPFPVPFPQPVQPNPVPVPIPVAGGDCMVDATLACTTVDGQDCAAIQAPSSRVCNEGSPMNVVQLSYQNTLCDSSMNFQESSICVDMAPLEEQVTISCFTGPGAPLEVEPAVVSTNGSFLVRTQGGEPLPERIECSIGSMQGVSIQTNVFDVSGTVSLNLGDNFGALQVEGCSEKTCRSILCYGITLSNTGSVEMDVTRLEFLFGQSVVDIASNVQPSTILPGQQIVLEEKYEIDICGGGTATAALDVQANPPNGAICQDVERLDVSLIPVPETPPVLPPTQDDVCPFQLGFNCIVTGNEINTGKACTAPDVGVVPCMDRPTAATMLFNGGSCGQSDNAQGSQFTCQDFNGGPPGQTGEEVHILVTDAQATTVYFDGSVRVGDFYPLQAGGSPFAEDQIVTVATADQSTVLQIVQYHSSCSTALELKNRFGASQLVGFINQPQGNVTCFSSFDLTLSMEIPAATTGAENVELTSLTVDTNFAGQIDLSNQVVGQVATAGGANVVVSLQGELDLSTRRDYQLIYTLEGIQLPGGVRCSGTGIVGFDAGGGRRRALRRVLTPPTLGFS